MEKLEIVSWVSFDSSYPTKRISNESLYEIINLIRSDIIKNKYVFTGQDHQNIENGAPLFSDGTIFRASMRCFAMIMDSIYSEDSSNPYSYMQYYMSLNTTPCYPTSNNVNIPAKEDEPFALGVTVAADQEMIEQSIENNMPLMTFDKVVKEMYEFILERLDDN